MSIVRNIVRAALLVLALVATTGRTASSVDPGSPAQCKHPILGIIEGPDPLTGRCAWETATVKTGNEPGFPRDPHTRRSVAVWAAPVGGDHDIALGEWGDGRFGRVTYLTSTLTDDLDPVLGFGADGALHVVWWSRGERDEVVHARRDPVSGGWSPDRIVASGARTPALAVADGLVWIAYLRRGAGDATEIVIGAQGNDREIEATVAARTLDRNVTGLTLSVTDRGPQLSWIESDGRVVHAERWRTGWILHPVGPASR